MSGLTRIDQVLFCLRSKLAHGGMTYQSAVDSEALVHAFEHIKAVVATETVKLGVVDRPLMSDTALNVLLRKMIG